MPIPIPDLEIGDDGITATLSFSRIPTKTHIPWSSVYIVSCDDGRRYLYYEDFPDDLLPEPSAKPADLATAELAAVDTTVEGDASDDEESPATDIAAGPKRRAPFLKSVPADAESEPEADASGDQLPARKRPQLKVVK
jgi:hypothetical protein